MKNFVQDGDYLDHVLAADVASGGVVVLPAGIGIASKAGLTGETVVLAVEGVFSLTKKAALALAIGAKVFWDATLGEITSTAADGVLCGYVSKPALAGDAKVDVSLEYGRVGQAAVVAALGTTSNLVGVDGAGSNAAPLVGTEARLDAIEAKVDALLASLKASGVMASA